LTAFLKIFNQISKGLISNSFGRYDKKLCLLLEINVSK